MAPRPFSTPLAMYHVRIVETAVIMCHRFRFLVVCLANFLTPYCCLLAFVAFENTHSPPSDNERQAERLRQQMQALPSDCEFLIHVGDIRENDGGDCKASEYEDVADILRLAPCPVFIVPGDNDWIDCANREEGMELFKEYFSGFESRYWDHDFNIEGQYGYPTNFAFGHKGTLFIGLNIPGGSIKGGTDAWETRLTDQVEWTKYLIDRYVRSMSPLVGRVVIFAHAELSSSHTDFTDPLLEFINNDLDNGVPIL